MNGHELLYRAGSSGLAYAGIPDNATPHWYCSCGGWRLNRNPRSGSPHRETATKHFRRHLATYHGERGDGMSPPHIVGKPGHVQPIHPFDTFCTCPRCELLGHHTVVGHGQYKPNLLADMDGRLTIDATGFGQRTSGPYTERRCTFCDFRWRTTENYSPES